MSPKKKTTEMALDWLKHQVDSVNVSKDNPFKSEK